jgi:MoxR-like ATPase
VLARTIHDVARDTQEVPLGLREGLERISQAQTVLNTRFVNRAEVVRGLMYALLTGHHCLLLGRTGTAKSLLVNQILDALARGGSRVFSIKASIDDTKDNYFGPIDVLAYREQGVKTRHLENSLLEADYAFIDEIFDTNEQVLRDLMLILSDGVLQEGPMAYKAPLQSVFAACNYLRVNEVTEALLDRFLFKIVVPQDVDPFSQLQIDMNTNAHDFDEALPFVDQAFVDRVVAIARGSSDELEVQIPTRVLFLKSIILSSYQAKMRKTTPDYYISPRRQARMLELMRLGALLAGRTEVDESDLSALRYMVGTVNGEQREVETFERTLEETLRYFDVDAKLATATELISFAYDMARSGSLDSATWARFEMALSASPDRERKRARPPKMTWDGLYRAIDGLEVTFSPLDDLRRGCLELIKRHSGSPVRAL